MGAALSVVRQDRQRFYKYGSDYFRHAILPACGGLLEEIGISHSHAAKIFDAFVKMDMDGSRSITVGEFHRYFGWKRGVFTERIFDVYASVTKDDGEPSKLSYEEFLICVWNYCTYDQELMAKYVFEIFDIDDVKSLSIDELDALLRMVYVNQDDDAVGAEKKFFRKSFYGETFTLKSFQ
jgi:Ca2+-binding EF-hand superfamily protein